MRKSQHAKTKISQARDQRNQEYKEERLRLDKWLWAARFFRTRTRAKQAIDGGKIECRGVRAKPASEITVGSVLKIHQGLDKYEVVVKVLSDRRRGAPEAVLLYEETQASQEARATATQARRLQRDGRLGEKRPTKKERRALVKLKDSRETGS